MIDQNSISVIVQGSIFLKGLYKSMQTIDHQIQVEITVIMQIVGAQHNTCCHHAASTQVYFVYKDTDGMIILLKIFI